MMCTKHTWAKAPLFRSIMSSSSAASGTFPALPYEFSLAWWGNHSDNTQADVSIIKTRSRKFVICRQQVKSNALREQVFPLHLVWLGGTYSYILIYLETKWMSVSIIINDSGSSLVVIGVAEVVVIYIIHIIHNIIHTALIVTHKSTQACWLHIADEPFISFTSFIFVSCLFMTITHVQMLCACCLRDY